MFDQIDEEEPTKFNKERARADFQKAITALSKISPSS